MRSYINGWASLLRLDVAVAVRNFGFSGQTAASDSDKNLGYNMPARDVERGRRSLPAMEQTPEAHRIPQRDWQL